MNNKVNTEILIIGAGIAGLSAAATIHQAGRSVIVIDKARGLGGRLSTRRQENSQWDHGGQYFTATDPRFAEQIASWQQQGVVSEWDAKICSWDGQQLQPVGEKKRYVGHPKMNAPLHHLATGLDIRLPLQATEISRIATGWQVITPSVIFECQELILAIPSPQAAALIPNDHPIQPTAAAAPVAPCWTLLLHSPHALPLTFGGLFVNQGPIGWAANNSSKTGRPAQAGEDWVIQATPAWSAEHIEAPADWVANNLASSWTTLLACLLPDYPQPEWASLQAHRWRFARNLPSNSALNATRLDKLTLCGDWLIDGRIEGAYLSGQQAAALILQQL